MSSKEFKDSEIGLIPKDWELVTLNKICNIIMGQSPPSKFYNTENEGLPFFQGRKDFGDKYPTVTVWCSEPKRIAECDDVLLSVRAPVGDINMAKERCCIGRGLSSVSMKNNNNEFLYYLIQYNKPRLKDIFESEGTVFGCITKKGLHDFEVAIPSENEQLKISEILSNLDKKIELNQKMNQTLEKIGHALFKHWFIDFEFPDADGKSYKSSGGKMVDSELGKIPKGWKIDKLGNYIDLERGLSYKGKFLCDDGKPMVNLGTIAPNCGFIYDGLKYYSGDFKEKNLVNIGDLVIANTDITQDREVLGSPAIVPPDLGCENALFTHHIFAVRNKSFLHNLFLYYLLQLRVYKGRVEGFATGTTVLALPKDAILDFEFSVPDEALVKRYEHIILPIHDKINQNNFENKNLSKIRDSLLQRLMSGKIRIKRDIIADHQPSKALEALE